MPELPSISAAELLFKALGRGQYPFLSVTSDSMAPLFRSGDEIQLGPVSPESLTVGDVIVLGIQDDLLAHRYWGAADISGCIYLITRGDRLAYYDPLLPDSQLKAVVIGRRRSGRLLDLRHGPGNWLNRRLTRLSKHEAQAIGLEWPAPGPQSNSQVRPNFARRILRRFITAIGALLVMLVDLLP